MKRKAIPIFILGLLTVGAIACQQTGSSEPAPIETKYVDLTADSIYGKLSNFSAETVQQIMVIHAN